MTFADAVESISTVDPFALSLLSIFGGVALTVLAGLIGAWIQGRREHSKWQRDQRLKAYGDFLSATDNYLGAARRNDEAEVPEVERQSVMASALVKLLGPNDAYNAALGFQNATKASVRALMLEPHLLDQAEGERVAAREAFINIARGKIKVKG